MIRPTLRTKLISAFLLVALVPMVVLGFLNERAIQKELTEDANMRLGANASQTATRLNEFVNENLNAVRSEAKLPVFTDYLQLPAGERPGSHREAEIVLTLHALSLKDFVNISSYALLDLRGANLIDTAGADIGLDKSDRDYVTNPLQTGLPFVSAMEVAPEPYGETGLYFSAPVRDASGTIIGVLAARYRAAILQRLIADHNGLAGEGSFAILLDENHVRLAHGAEPDQVFKSVVPLSAKQVAELQSKMRLPVWNDTDLTTNNPSFEMGLVNATFDPHFQAPIGTAGNLNYAAVTKMQKLPWLVVYTQPQDTFLAPIRARTRNTVLAGFVIALLAVVAAMGVAQLLTGPIIRLTAVAKKISAGDLTARATVEASDEIGTLANTLNNMTRNLEEHIAERELLIEELEVKNAELERFDYTISHELKSPLITIAGFSGLLLDDAKTGNSEKLVTHVQHITSAVDTMSVLLDQLLELSRIGRVIHPPETIAFGNLAHEVLELIDSQAIGREFTIEIAPDLPQVYGDRIRLREVLQNLIENAIKFHDGQSRPHVKIGSRKHAAEEVIYVQDNGMGIDPAYHDKVFGLFERLNPAIEGTGIGLSLVQRIIHEHGGRIWVESKGAGTGSTFCFTIPQVKES
ncbi:MAG: sensor histidine kinase [Pseudomonadales bacterium]